MRLAAIVTCAACHVASGTSHDVIYQNTAPSGTLPPVTIITNPLEGATGVALDAPITFFFSRDVAAFAVASPDTPIAQQYSNQTLTVTASWRASRVYSITVVADGQTFDFHFSTRGFEPTRVETNGRLPFRGAGLGFTDDGRGIALWIAGSGPALYSAFDGGIWRSPHVLPSASTPFTQTLAGGTTAVIANIQTMQGMGQRENEFYVFAGDSLVDHVLVSSDVSAIAANGDTSLALTVEDGTLKARLFSGSAFGAPVTVAVGKIDAISVQPSGVGFAAIWRTGGSTGTIDGSYFDGATRSSLAWLVQN